MDRYLPPAGIDDFSRSQHADGLRNGWNQNISDTLAQVRDPASYPLASPLFYDQLADTSGVPDGAPVPVPWNGFPLRLTKWYGAVNDSQANAAGANSWHSRKPSSTIRGVGRVLSTSASTHR